MQNPVVRRSLRSVRSLSLIAALGAVAGASACAMHHNDVAGQGDSSVITEEEIDSSHAYNAFDVVYKLRPRFLTSRGKLSLDPRVPPAYPNVFVDNMAYGDVSMLRGIAASSIESIKFYDAAEAQYKFGHGNMAGVISVVTKH